MKKGKARKKPLPLGLKPEDIPSVLPADWTWEGDFKKDHEEVKILDEKLHALATMLPNPLAPDALRDIFKIFEETISSEPEIDDNNKDHVRLRDLWLSIGEKSFELQTLLLKALPRNQFNARLSQYKFYQDYCDRRGEILSGLELLTKSSGDHFILLDKLAKGRKGGRSQSSETAYALLLKFWIDRGGKPAVSMNGPCATFLMDASELLLGAAPGPDAVPGIVTRAKKTLALVYGDKYAAMGPKTRKSILA